MLTCKLSFKLSFKAINIHHCSQKLVSNQPIRLDHARWRNYLHQNASNVQQVGCGWSVGVSWMEAWLPQTRKHSKNTTSYYLQYISVSYCVYTHRHKALYRVNPHFNADCQLHIKINWILLKVSGMTTSTNAIFPLSFSLTLCLMAGSQRDRVGFKHNAGASQFS